jgi:hypothetical protein
MKGIRLLHLKHANEENPKSIEAVIEMEASSMLHKVYLANSVSPCLTRKGCWFSMLENFVIIIIASFLRLHEESSILLPWP